MMLVRMTATVGVAASLLVGCGGGDAPAEPPPPAAAPQPPVGPAPLAVDQRVIPGDLAGLRSPAGVKTTTTKEGYAEALGNPAEADYGEERAGDIAKLADKGFVSGAAKLYTDGGASNRGVSSVAQLAGPGEGQAYEQALYTEEFAEGLSPAATKGAIAGATASHTLIGTVSEDGEVVNHAWASFVDGPFVYLVETESKGAALDSQAVIDAANTLFAKVKDSPPAG